MAPEAEADQFTFHCPDCGAPLPKNSGVNGVFECHFCFSTVTRPIKRKALSVGEEDNKPAAAAPKPTPAAAPKPTPAAAPKPTPAAAPKSTETTKSSSSPSKALKPAKETKTAKPAKVSKASKATKAKTTAKKK